MKKIINNIQNSVKNTIKNLVVIVAATGIGISPFIVDYSTLPKGYELPKVLFIQIISSLIIFLILNGFLYKTIKNKKVNLPSSILIPIIISVLLILGTVGSPFPEIALWGNPFRLQGLITYLLIIWAAYGVFLSINRDSWHIISSSIILSTIVQCAIAITHFMELTEINPNLILEGIWVNGTFGQANWFAGRILIAIVICAYYLGLRFNLKWYLRFSIKLYFALLVLLFLVTLGLTYSEWGIISAFVAIITIILYEVLSRRTFALMVGFSTLILLFGAIAFIILNTTYNLRLEIYSSIYNLFTQPLNLQQLKIILFGFGFDTLGEVFKAYGQLRGLLVDRAHNFILDILSQNGLLILVIFSGLIFKTFINLFNKNKDRIFDFTFIALLLWMFRSIIHENGIVNLFDFILLLSVALALRTSLHRFNSINIK